MFERDTLYIGGTHEKPSSKAMIDVRSPFTEESWGECPRRVGRTSIAPSRRPAAFEEGPWTRAIPSERADVLDRLLAALQQR